MSFEALIPYASVALGVFEAEIVHAFRPATAADLPGLLTLRRTVTPSIWWNDETYVHWRYFRRPMPDGQVPYWVLVLNGTVLAACGLEPVRLVIDGHSVDAIRTLDIMVRPDLEGLGLGAFMNLILFRNFPIVIVTGSNHRSHRLLTRMFHHTADLVFWKSFLASHDVIKARLQPAPFSGVIATAADLLFRLTRSRVQVRVPRGVHLREITRFDDGVTALSARNELAGRVLVRRSADYLNWRFLDNPRCQYFAYGAFNATTLLGYVVGRFNLERENPRREGDIVDWLVQGDAAAPQSPLPSLFGAAIRKLARKGAQIVTCAAHDAGLQPTADLNGFMLRSDQQIPFFVHASSADVHRRLASEPGWYLTRADLDVE